MDRRIDPAHLMSFAGCGGYAPTRDERSSSASTSRVLRITDGNVAQAARLAKRNRSDGHSLLARYQLNSAAFKPDRV